MVLPARLGAFGPSFAGARADATLAASYVHLLVLHQRASEARGEPGPAWPGALVVLTPRCEHDGS